MLPAKPRITAADMLVTSLSPVLIILLVESLCFFLVQVFYQGEAAGSVRWVLFWFVLAVVLVARIGLEQGNTHATVYGLALAAATWLYLLRIHPSYLLGALMLGIIWWCAHKLTWDCTLIEEDDDASGSGLMQTAWAKDKKPPQPSVPAPARVPAHKEKRKPTSGAVKHAPGVWLIYFSVAALPLFGIGQTLLPSGDTAARRMGLMLLFLYLTAALGLLLTTSFLGLRRYLRQRYLKMSGDMAFGWMRFGLGVAVAVLIAALLLPRPGVGQAWGSLRYHIDHQLRRASEYALKLNPPGKGSGRPGNQGQKSTGPEGQSDNNGKGQPGQEKSQDKTGAPSQTAKNDGTASGEQPNTQHSDTSKTPDLTSRIDGVFNLLKVLLILVAALVAGWWLFRRRELLWQMAKSAVAALVQFFRDLFSFGRGLTSKAGTKTQTELKRRPFTSYKNPFATGQDREWTAAELILYSYEALQSRATEQGLKSSQEQTAREFCASLGETIPELAPDLNHLAFLYAHVAYANSLPANYNLESLRTIWSGLLEQHDRS